MSHKKASGETVTASDWRSLCYFWQYKGDVTRWVGWETHKKEIGEKYPELIFAVSQKMIAERTIDAVIQRIETEEGQE